MTAKIIYEGKLRTSSVHISSGNQIITDAPIDNHGLGTTFSPTDLVVSSLASCMLTIMGIKAEQKEMNIEGSNIEATKIMFDAPRRIGRIELKIVVKFDQKWTQSLQELMINVAKTCPVFHSLNKNIEFDFDFKFIEDF